MLTQKRTGFTIVELLIVIVVIAIIASIATVAYRGIRERAVTVAYTSAIDQWDKLLRVEAAFAGGLPSTSGIICLGKATSDFPVQVGVWSAGECVKTSTGTSYTYSSTFFDALLDKSGLPNGLLPITTFTTSGITYTSRGILLFVNASSRTYVLQWFPQIGDECGRGVSTTSSGPGSLGGGLCSLTVTY